MRTACGVALFLAAWASGPARADEKSPPPPRFLSLAEARALALENVFGRVGGIRVRVLAVSTATGPGTLVVLLGGVKPGTEFERQVGLILLNAETAYWDLYGAYWNLFSQEQGVRFARETHDHTVLAYAAGRAKAADPAQARGQYELFRAQRLQAVQNVAKCEQQLRALLGLPGKDDRRLVPRDAPALTKFKTDWDRSLGMALWGRPELRRARAEVLVGEVKFALARALAREDWPLLNLALRVSPREALDDEQEAAADLDSARDVLRDMEIKAERFLALEYGRLATYYKQAGARRAQREAFGEQLKARQEAYLAGRGTLDITLEAQRFWADALANEYQAIVSHNNALVAFEYARGNLLRHSNVSITAAEPKGEHVRAVERERRRALELLRATPALPPNALLNPMWEAPKAGPPPLLAPALPALFKRVPLLNEAAIPLKE
jgi:hypothetical protein